MLREVVFRGLDATPRLEEALRQATRRLERVVSRFDPETAFLRVVLAAHRKLPRYDVSTRLTVRGGMMHARETQPDPVAAVKRAFAELQSQFRRHASLVRREHLRDKVYRPAQVLAEQLAQQAAREAEAIKPLDADQIARLQRFIRREALYRRLDGRFPHGVSPQSVVDDTVVLALEEADEKPHRMSYEAWLMKLARRALDRRGLPPEAGNGSEDTHVESDAYEAGLLEPPSDDDWLTYFQPDEDPSVGDVTVDESVHSPEDLMARRELQSHVHRILGQLPESWRHAFTLYTIEGFDVNAVASSLDCEAEMVRHQVALATEFLREKLKETGYRRPSGAGESRRT
jgi:DNA-directed RNA polymerase specialized sigma24 family protein/ribosome-associated translation inhibitor RaiA